MFRLDTKIEALYPYSSSVCPDFIFCSFIKIEREGERERERDMHKLTEWDGFYDCYICHLNFKFFIF